MAPFLAGQTVFRKVFGANGSSDRVVLGTVLGTDEADVIFKDSDGHITIQDRRVMSHTRPILSYDYQSGQSHFHYGSSEPVTAPASPSYTDFRNGYFCGPPSPTSYEDPLSRAMGWGTPPHLHACHDERVDAADALLALSRDIAIY